MYLVPADGSPGWARRMRSFQSQSGLRPIRSDGRPAGPDKHGACDMTSPPCPNPPFPHHAFYLSRMNSSQPSASSEPLLFCNSVSFLFFLFVSRLLLTIFFSL